MPRVSREAKAASHARIVEAAARQFRQQGIEATGVADVMKAAGLTHGGFYRHFSSKDELAAAAIGQAFEQILERMRTVAHTKENGPALRAIVDMFLSPQHVADAGGGCPIVALGGEAARGGKAERQALDDGIARVSGRLAELIGGEAALAQERSASLLLLMVGTMVLARAATDDETMHRRLEAGRRFARTIIQT